MTTAGLLDETDGRGVRTLTLDRPGRRNAFDEAMAIAMGKAFADVGDEVRLLVLRGVGSYFCSGFDLRSQGTLPVDEGMAMMAKTYRRLAEIRVPTLAVVRGGAAGGGLGLVAACDIVVTEASARFVSPEGKHGILPAVILPYIARAVGFRQATALALSGLAISATDALALGLVQAVVEPEAIEQEGERWIDAVLAVAPSVARSVKPYVRSLERLTSPAEWVQLGAGAAAESRAGPDAREGRVAFRERRPPNWSVTLAA